MSDFHTNYLMNIASLLFFICYIPEAYANIRNKNANGYNIPEKVLMLFGTVFALSYAVTIKNTSLILNYAPLLTLDCTMLSIRVYYAYFYKKKSMELIDSECEMIETPNPIHNVYSVSTIDSDI